MYVFTNRERPRKLRPCYCLVIIHIFIYMGVYMYVCMYMFIYLFWYKNEIAHQKNTFFFHVQKLFNKKKNNKNSKIKYL